MIKNIKFNHYMSKFQKLLENNKIIVFADKTVNWYITNPKFYKKLVIDNITKSYKISKEDITEIISSKSEKNN